MIDMPKIGVMRGKATNVFQFLQEISINGGYHSSHNFFVRKGASENERKRIKAVSEVRRQSRAV